jgi:sulfite exporter TauE/SafE
MDRAMSVNLWMALSIGILGSLHCVGMCGPIAIMVPGDGNKFWSSSLLYHLGKIMSYATVGAIIGVIGQGIAFAGMQSWLSIAMGLGMLAVVLLSIPVEAQVIKLPLAKRFYQYISSRLNYQLKQNPSRTGLSIGFLNGFIPCGLVYLAVAGAITMKSWWEGALFMILFGLGTMPALIATAYFSRRITGPFRSKVNKLMPIFLTIIALVFIYRGLQVELPVDLRFWEMKENPQMCH